MNALTLDLLSSSEKRELLDLLEEKKRRSKQRRIDSFYPDTGPLSREHYPKHMAFFEAGVRWRQRGVIAANRVGKTEGLGGYETAVHLTGKYPHWWKGRRFVEPVNWLVAGKTGTTTRDIPQYKLLGTPQAPGTGLIQGNLIRKTRPKSGIPEAIDLALIQHESGSNSVLQFRSYDQGRQGFEGTERDGIWLDEEPPEDVYGECVIRTMTTQGLVICTFTPLEGGTEVVRSFLSQPEPPIKYSLQIGWNDAPHLTDAEKEEQLRDIPSYLRKARTQGIPTLGSGPVFPIDEDSIRVDPFPIPDWWPQLGGVDFGWDHPFAACKLGWDRDSDVVYVTATYRQRESTPLVHCAALKPWSKDNPGLIFAWPHDGLQHDKGSGKQLAEQYREHGLNLYFEHAQFSPNPDGSPGGFGLEAGITMMLERLETGRLKVFSTLTEWFEEFRMYHRKEGLIVKERDDLMSATRIALMMLRVARGSREAPVKDRYARKKAPVSGGWGA